jgi:hypothetical protein
MHYFRPNVFWVVHMVHVYVRGKIVQTQTGGMKDHWINIIEASFGSQNQLTNKNVSYGYTNTKYLLKNFGSYSNIQNWKKTKFEPACSNVDNT